MGVIKNKKKQMLELSDKEEDKDEGENENASNNKEDDFKLNKTKHEVQILDDAFRILHS